MTDHLENAIRQLFRDTGPLDRDEVAVLLLDLLDRIQNIEAKPWVGLTDEDAQEVIEKSMQAITGGSNTFRVSANSVWTAIVRSVEAKLREKNTPQQSKGDA